LACVILGCFEKFLDDPYYEPLPWFMIQHAKYYSLADEVTDSSNKGKFVVCIHWIDKNLQAHEDFIGIYHVDTIEANCLVERLKDTLL